MKRNPIEQISIKMRDLRADELLEMMKSVDDLEKQDRDGRTLLINAAFYHRTEIVSYLLAQKVNVNAVDKSGFSALHAAVQENCTDIVARLIDAGADVNLQNQFGNPPIWGISLKSSPDLIKLLMQSGANPHIKNKYGISTFESMAAYPQIIDMIDNN